MSYLIELDKEFTPSFKYEYKPTVPYTSQFVLLSCLMNFPSPCTSCYLVLIAKLLASITVQTLQFMHLHSSPVQILRLSQNYFYYVAIIID